MVSTMKKCSVCGWPANNNDRYSSKCGHTILKSDFQDSNLHVTPDKERTILLLLSN